MLLIIVLTVTKRIGDKIPGFDVSPIQLSAAFILIIEFEDLPIGLHRSYFRSVLLKDRENAQRTPPRISMTASPGSLETERRESERVKERI